MRDVAASDAEYCVLVPFYSNLDHLRNSLLSVVAQTDRSWRVVVVDDSPVDPGVGDLVAALGDDRISVVRNERNLGVAGSFNRCFELAIERGAELAMILHADDELGPDYVAAVREMHAREPDAVAVAVNALVIGSDGRPRRSTADAVKHLLWPRRLDRLEGERGLRLLLRGQFFYCPAVSYRMSRVPRPAWNDRWSQVMDLDLYGRMLLGGETIMLERRALFRYRRHDASMTQVNSGTLLRTREETQVCRYLAAAARAQGWPRAARAGRARATVRLQALLRAVRLLVAGHPRRAGRAARMSASR
jgi:glycosyltransferase involved in cell wall biosynthesis